MATASGLRASRAIRLDAFATRNGFAVPWNEKGDDMKCPRCKGRMNAITKSLQRPVWECNECAVTYDATQLELPPAVRRAFRACKRQIKAGRAYATVLHAHQAMRKDLTDNEQSTILRAADRAGCADTRALRAIARAEGKGKEKA